MQDKIDLLLMVAACGILALLEVGTYVASRQLQLTHWHELELRHHSLQLYNVPPSLLGAIGFWGPFVFLQLFGLAILLMKVTMTLLPRIPIEAVMGLIAFCVLAAMLEGVRAANVRSRERQWGGAQFRGEPPFRAVPIEVAPAPSATSGEA